MWTCVSNVRLAASPALQRAYASAFPISPSFTAKSGLPNSNPADFVLTKNGLPSVAFLILLPQQLSAVAGSAPDLDAAKARILALSTTFKHAHVILPSDMRGAACALLADAASGGASIALPSASLSPACAVQIMLALCSSLAEHAGYLAAEPRPTLADDLERSRAGVPHAVASLMRACGAAATAESASALLTLCGGSLEDLACTPPETLAASMCGGGLSAAALTSALHEANPMARC